MKLVHLYLALSCALFFSLSQHASAQDAEKEDAASEETAGGDTAGGDTAGGDTAGGDTAAGGGGDAAPAEGGGEGGAAPAAGGESAAAPAAAGESAPAAPAGGGESAPAAAAPAPVAAAPAAAPAPAAPAPAPAPAFDMGAAVQSSAVAPPPAAAVAESNPIVATVVATGGDVSLSDIATIGVSNIKKLAANPSSGGGINLSNLKRNLVGKVNVVKAFKGDIDDLVEVATTLDEDSLESFSTLDRSEVVVLAQGKTLQNDAAGLAELTKTSTKAKVAKVAKDNGKSMTEQLTIINDYTDDQLDALKDFGLDDLDAAFQAGGDDALADPDQLARTAEIFKEAGDDAADLLAKLDSAVVTDINGLPLILKDGNKFTWADQLNNLEFFIVESADNDTEYSDAPQITRIKIDKDGYLYGTDTEETTASFSTFLSSEFDFSTEEAASWKDRWELVSPSVLHLEWHEDDSYDAENPGEIEAEALIKLINYNGRLESIYLEFGPEDQDEWDEFFAESYDQDFLDALEAAVTFDDLPDSVKEYYADAFADMENGYEIGTFTGDAEEALSLYQSYWDTQAEVLLKDDNGNPVVVTFRKGQKSSDDIDAHFNYTLDGVTITTLDVETDGSDYGLTEEPTLTTRTFTANTISWEEDGKTVTESYEVLGEGILKVTNSEENRITYISVFRVNDYGNYQNEDGLIKLTFYDIEEGESFNTDEYEAFRYGWHTYSPSSVGLVFANKETALASSAYSQYSNNWDYSPYKDTDGDGVADKDDAFPNDATKSADLDGDGVDDINDPDIDGDGIANAQDSFPRDRYESTDTDGDGIGDNSDPDIDGDGTFNFSDAFPYDSDKVDPNPSLLLNMESLLSNDDEQAIQNYINGEYTDAASLSAIQASLELLEWALTDRTINGGDLSLDPIYTDMGGFRDPEDINWQLPQVQNFLGILTEMHLLGDSTSENKQKVTSFLEALYDSPELASVLDGTNDQTSSLGNLVDSLIGADRGFVDDESSDRISDLGLALGNGVSNIDNVTMKALVGSNNDISGAIIDADQTVESVDLTIIASMRDTTISNDLTILAPESAKEDAYVIAAADELYLRGEWNEDNHADFYVDPPKMNIEVQNSSLALAAVDEMNMVNVDITTGGSLAIASLDEINIWASDPSNPNVFTVGADMDDDFESLFLYGQKLIEINGLNVQGRVDDVYMEAYTINLSNVTFPSNAAVLLRSENGIATFDANPTIGHGNVNLHQVRHYGVTGDHTTSIGTSHLNAGNNYTSANVSQSGRPYMKVESYK